MCCASALAAMEPSIPIWAPRCSVAWSMRDNGHDTTIEAFHSMVHEGALPNARTNTIIIAHLASTGFVDQALKVFCILPSRRSWTTR